jgi:SAM-dependent methyltransferase
MYTRTARLYDKIYAFRNYRAAADRLRHLIKEHHPTAETLLDVGCGTGLHLEYLQHDFAVEGLDIDSGLIAVARERSPNVPFHVADMTDFALGRRFDVVTCLFSAIAYVETIERVEAAVQTMRDHLNPGGLLLIEPWFGPETYWRGRLVANFHDEPELKFSWIYLNGQEGTISILDIHYTVGTLEGVEQFREVHRMGLFSREQYMDVLARAGLTVRHDPEGLSRRGLFIGRREGRN